MANRIATTGRYSSKVTRALLLALAAAALVVVTADRIPMPRVRLSPVPSFALRTRIGHAVTVDLGAFGLSGPPGDSPASPSGVTVYEDGVPLRAEHAAWEITCIEWKGRSSYPQPGCVWLPPPIIRIQE
jgi:hypothetical protein